MIVEFYLFVFYDFCGKSYELVKEYGLNYIMAFNN